MSEEYEDYEYDNPDVHDNVKDALYRTVLLIAFGVVALVGNVLYIRSIVVYKSLRIPLFLCLLSIAAADLICVVVTTPTYIYEITQSYYVNGTWHRTHVYLHNMTSYVVAYHVVALAVIRGCILIDRTHSFPTKKQVIGTSCVIWFLSVTANLPLLLSGEEEAISEFCVVHRNKKAKRNFILGTFFLFIIPVLGCFLIYLITRSMKKRYFSESYPREERHMSRLITVTVLLLVICQTPLHVVSIIIFNRKLPETNDFEEDPCSLFVVRNYLLCLALVDKAIRPIMYAKLSHAVGETLDEVINCTICHRHARVDDDDDNGVNESGYLSKHMPIYKGLPEISRDTTV